MKPDELKRLFRKGDIVELFITGMGKRRGKVIQLDDELVGLDTGASNVFATCGQVQGVTVYR
jgi:hypothetical protein